MDTPVDPGVVRGSSMIAFEEIVNHQRAEMAKRLLGATNLIAMNAPNLRVTSSLLGGLPKDAFVSEAERFGADVVVIGSHGYGPIRRFFLGSVSLFVAHHAPCSVLIVRQPPKISPLHYTPASA